LKSIVERVGEWGLVKMSVPALTLRVNDSINTFLETSYDVGFLTILLRVTSSSAG